MFGFREINEIVEGDARIVHRQDKPLSAFMQSLDENIDINTIDLNELDKPIIIDNNQE